jgi:phenylpyruvate tautomerase PptA (4-oxalocrotonate tautomerase family)
MRTAPEAERADRQGVAVPVITVNLWEETLSESTEERVIAAVTDAIVAVLGEQARPFTTVMIVGVPMQRWSTGGIVARELEDLPRRRRSIRDMLAEGDNGSSPGSAATTRTSPNDPA